MHITYSATNGAADALCPQVVDTTRACPTPAQPAVGSGSAMSTNQVDTHASLLHPHKVVMEAQLQQPPLLWHSRSSSSGNSSSSSSSHHRFLCASRASAASVSKQGACSSPKSQKSAGHIMSLQRMAADICQLSARLSFCPPRAFLHASSCGGDLWPYGSTSTAAVMRHHMHTGWHAPRICCGGDHHCTMLCAIYTHTTTKWVSGYLYFVYSLRWVRASKSRARMHTPLAAVCWRVTPSAQQQQQPPPDPSLSPPCSSSHPPGFSETTPCSRPPLPAPQPLLLHGQHTTTHCADRHPCARRTPQPPQPSCHHQGSDDPGGCGL